MKPSAFITLAVFAAVIWVVEIVDWAIGHRLDQYGIVPRTRDGLVGIAFSPFLHASWGHVVLNTVPLLFMGALIAFEGQRRFLTVTLIVALVGGALVWVFGRNAIHIGASGVVFGYFGYLVARAWYQRSLVAVLVAILVVGTYGTVILGILPSVPGVSWEAHLFGLLSGVLSAWITRRRRGLSPAVSRQSPHIPG